MATWRVNNSTLLGGEVCAEWQANHAYSLGARCVCTGAYATTARRAFVWECTTAGTSHATTEPVWPTSGTIADGTVVWTCRQPNDGNWDNASCILHYVLNHGIGFAVADLTYVDDGHSEAISNMAGFYILKGGTTGIVRVYCVNKVDDSLSVGAVVCQAHATNDMEFQNEYYSYGITYKNNIGHIQQHSAACATILESNGGDVIELVGAGGYFMYGNLSAIGVLKIINGNIRFGNAANYIKQQYAGHLIWEGGSLVGTAPTILFDTGSHTLDVKISDVNLSNLGANALIDIANHYNYFHAEFTRCKMPATFNVYTGTWAGDLLSGAIKLHHCSDGNRAYDFQEVSLEGICSDETTIVRTGGASDGTTPISIKMVSSAAEGIRESVNGLESPPIHGFTDSTTSKTFTIEVVHDSLTALKNNEIWMSLEYPANNTDGLGAIAFSKCAPLGTPADIPDSTEAWTTTGMTNPNTRKLSVTVTPGKKGPITARVFVGKASQTVYIDPKITEA